MSSIKFDVNSPAAKQLTVEVFNKIRELWDPTLSDDAVAQYTVALAARGSDRKKLQSSLKGLIGEDAAKDLVDWLLRHVSIHKTELISSKAPPKPAAKSSQTKQDQQAGSSAAEVKSGTSKQKPAPVKQESPASQAKQEAAGSEGEGDEVNNVEALLNEGVDDEYEEEEVQEEEEEELQHHQRQASSSQRQQEPRHTSAAASEGQAARARDRISTDGKPHGDQQLQDQQAGKRARVRSAIQWTEPAPAPGGGSKAANGASRNQHDTSAPRGSELEARRNRFQGDGDRERDRETGEQDQRDNGAPSKHGGDRDRGERERDVRGSGRLRQSEVDVRRRSRSRSRSPRRPGAGPWGPPPFRDGPPLRDWDRGKDWPAHEPDWDQRPGYHAHPRDLRGPVDGDWPHGRPPPGRRMAYEDDRYLEGPPLQGRLRPGGWEGPPQRDPYADRHRSISPQEPPVLPVESPRPRLRSVVSGSGSLDAALGDPGLHAAAAGQAAEPAGEERQANPAKAAGRMLGRALNIFSRLSGGKFGDSAPRLARRESDRAATTVPISLAQPAAGRGSAKRPAASDDEDDVGSEGELYDSPDREPTAPSGGAPTPPKVRRTQAGQSVGSALMAGAAAKAAAVQSAGLGLLHGRLGPAPGSTAAAATAGAATAAQQRVVAGALQTAHMRQARQAAAAQQQQLVESDAPATMASAAANQPVQAKPGAANLNPTAAAFVPAAAKPGAGGSVGAGVKPAAGAKAPSQDAGELAKLMADMKAQEAEIRRLKAQMTKPSAVPGAQPKHPLQAGAPTSAAAPAAAAAPLMPPPASASAAELAAQQQRDSRSVLVQNCPNISEQLLLEVFGPCGPIHHVTVLRNTMTGMPTGSAYVEFASVEGKANAMKRNGFLVGDRALAVRPKPVQISAATAAMAAGTRPPVAQLAGGAAWPAMHNAPMHLGMHVGMQQAGMQQVAMQACMQAPAQSGLQSGMPSIIPPGMPAMHGMPLQQPPGMAAPGMGVQQKRLADAPPLQRPMVWRRPGGDAGGAAGAQAHA